MMYSQETLVRQLREIGICPTDTITIHSSLRAIGEINGGAEALIDALRTAVNDGLLLIPAHTYQNIREVPVFDVRNTKPCIGTLPCVAVELANRAFEEGNNECRRSMHPSHSVVAFGKSALTFILGDCQPSTISMVGGSYSQLIESKAKILLAGVGLKKNTFLHAVYEYMYAEQEPHPLVDIQMIDYDGTVTIRQNCGAYGYSGDFEYYQKVLEQNGALIYGKLGDAELMVCDAARCFTIVMNILKQNG